MIFSKDHTIEELVIRDVSDELHSFSDIRLYLRLSNRPVDVTFGKYDEYEWALVPLSERLYDHVTSFDRLLMLFPFLIKEIWSLYHVKGVKKDGHFSDSYDFELYSILPKLEIRTNFNRMLQIIREGNEHISSSGIIGTSCICIELDSISEKDKEYLCLLFSKLWDGWLDPMGALTHSGHYMVMGSDYL